MAIRSEKKKVMQQIVNDKDSGLDFDPQPLMNKGDEHWFNLMSKKPASGSSTEADIKPSSDKPTQENSKF